MPDLSGFPYFEIRYDRDGRTIDGGEIQALIEGIGERQIGDLIVVSHGWNNDMDEAREHYRQFASRLRDEMDRPGTAPADRRYAILGVLWPSKKFAERDLIPGGAAGAGSDDRARLVAQLDDLKGVLGDDDADATLERAKELVARLESDSVQDEFADMVRSLVKTDAQDAEDAADVFLEAPGREVFDRLSAPLPAGPPPRPTGGGAAGGAAGLPPGGAAGGSAGLGQLAAGVFAAGQRFLNFLTYYQMKERAGTIGKAGLASVLRRIRDAHPEVRLHLVGHSFGARLVTAATAAAQSVPSARPNTLTLLQAAFSHNGFAREFVAGRDGAFRNVVSDGLVRGPILISHTDNDKAVGLAYAIASRVARQQASAIGGPNDQYGGLGRNGARHTPEAEDGRLESIDAVYDFTAGKVYNLRADSVIMDHGDIHKAEVAHALVQAMAG